MTFLSHKPCDAQDLDINLLETLRRLFDSITVYRRAASLRGLVLLLHAPVNCFILAILYRIRVYNIYLNVVVVQFLYQFT